MMLDDRGVQALGKVSEERKLAELARADVVCAPSLHGESFGMVLTEAFAAATPVLASDIPGYRDVVRDGLDGLLVPPGDALALAEALRALALDPRLRERMARAARERAERFAWPHVAAEVLDCYEQALRVGSAGHAARARWPSATASRPPTCCRASRRAAAVARRPPGRRSSGARAALRTLRRAGLAASSLAGAALAALALQRVGVDPRRRLAARLQARPARRRPRADVRRDVRPRALLARDPRRRAHLAARQTPRRHAGHVHRRAHVRHAARPPRRALARADRRAAARARARDAARRARHDRLPDAAQPARARHPRRRHALERQRPRRPRSRAAADRARAARSRCSRSRSRPCSLPPAALSRSRRAARAARRAAPLAAAPARRPARVRAAAPRRPSPPPPSSARGRCSGSPAGCC